jgi:hypothetical protein
MRNRRACMRLASAGVVHYNLGTARLASRGDNVQSQTRWATATNARLRWAIQDSNPGPLPYQKGLRTAPSGRSPAIDAKAGFV